MSVATHHECRHCDKGFYSNKSDATEPEKFCSEDCENEYEPDVCDECNEELDDDWEHECPMVDCEANPEHGQYNENQEQDGCPVCLDESYAEDED